MRMLGEMGAAIPASGSFSHYARLGDRRVGRLRDGLALLVHADHGAGREITGGASAIVNDWVPSIPQWVVALVFVVFFAVVNLAKVSNFGEFEFWFAAIKVTVIIGFLIIGVLLVFGILPPDTDPVGTSNLFGQGGFMPNGLSGIAAGLLVVAFAFGGIEIVTIAAAESENPERSIAVAVRSVVWRISVFYIGAISIMVLVLPWNDPELESGPFVAVLNKANIPGVAGFMELVVVVALLSAFNANIYGTSRMAFSLSRRGDGPAFMRNCRAPEFRPMPFCCRCSSASSASCSTGCSPDDLLGILLNAVGAALLVIWIFIVVSHLRLRKQLEASGKLTVRMWLFPYLSYATLAMLGVFVVLMLFDADARAQLISTTVLFLVIAALGFLNARWRKQNQPSDPCAYASRLFTTTMLRPNTTSTKRAK